MIVLLALYSEIILFSLNVLIALLAIACEYSSFAFPVCYILCWLSQLLALAYLVFKWYYPVQFLKYKSLLASTHSSYLDYMIPRKKTETSVSRELGWLRLFLRRIGILLLLYFVPILTPFWSSSVSTSTRVLMPLLILIWAVCDTCAFSALLNVPLYEFSQHPIAVALICPIQCLIEMFVVGVVFWQLRECGRGDVVSLAIWAMIHILYYCSIVRRIRL
jgi:hypothetical protein